VVSGYLSGYGSCVGDSGGPLLDRETDHQATTSNSGETHYVQVMMTIGKS